MQTSLKHINKNNLENPKISLTHTSPKKNHKQNHKQTIKQIKIKILNAHIHVLFFKIICEHHKTNHKESLT